MTPIPHVDLNGNTILLRPEPRPQWTLYLSAKSARALAERLLVLAARLEAKMLSPAESAEAQRRH